MPNTNIPPSISETAFSCPHCGAYTTQYWCKVGGSSLSKNSTPIFPDDERIKKLQEDTNMSTEGKSNLLKQIKKFNSGLVFISNDYFNGDYTIYNLNFSICYNCNEISIWVHKNLIFPVQKYGIAPNTDLPEDIIHDFEEARTIINYSPRGACALLRLCIQKLLIHLGESGKTLDQDIKNLVSKGLHPLIQRSLDIIRVIGNEAVHPGKLDLKDDRDTANELLMLINSIAEQMISHPKKVEEIYEKLPPEKRNAIEIRDNKK